MSYADEVKKPGRVRYSKLRLSLDFCNNTYGVLPCTASLPAGQECYNTRKTCQDTPNYAKTVKHYFFSSPVAHREFFSGALPVIVTDPKTVPTEIKPDRGLSVRSKVVVEIQDMEYHDRSADPYFDTRDKPAEGQYFGRLLARNPYFVGRLMLVRTGYLTPGGTFNSVNKLYIISAIDGPIINKERVLYKITGKDLLDYASSGRALVPPPTDGALNAGITISATSLVLDAGTTVADYPTGGGTIAIGDEWVDYTARSGTTISGLTRGQYGTDADGHDAGDAVQLAKKFTGSPVKIIDEILDDFTSIDGDLYIPYDAGLTTPTGTNDEWDDEEDNWLTGINLSVVIGEPTQASGLINEICESFQIDLWWDEEEQKVKLKVNAPPLGNASVSELNDFQHLIADKTKIKDDSTRRISRVIFQYAKINAADDDRASNFARHHFQVSGAEGVDLYNEIKTRVIKSRWLSAAEDGQAVQTAQRLLDRFGDTPKTVTFSVDAKDSTISVGQVVDITSAHFQDVDGSELTLRFQVIKKHEAIQGHIYQYTALSLGFGFSARNGFVADNALPNYSSASDAQKLANAFIGPNTGVFSDGAGLYKVI